MNKPWTPLLIALLLGSVSAAHAAGKLHKWTDDKGRVHYTEIAPTAADREKAATEPEEVVAPVEDAPVVIPEPTDLAASQQAATQCQDLYNELERYKSNQPLTDSEGKPLVVSPEMRQTKIVELNAQLDQTCR